MDSRFAPAHKLHKANSRSKPKRTNDVLRKPVNSECYRQAVGTPTGAKEAKCSDRPATLADAGARTIERQANCIARIDAYTQIKYRMR